MNKIKIEKNTTQFANQAWARNDKTIITGEALILGLLMHTTAGSRDSDDMRVVQSLMNDANLGE